MTGTDKADVWDGNIYMPRYEENSQDWSGANASLGDYLFRSWIQRFQNVWHRSLKRKIIYFKKLNISQLFTVTKNIYVYNLNIPAGWIEFFLGHIFRSFC